MVKGNRPDFKSFLQENCPVAQAFLPAVPPTFSRLRMKHPNAFESAPPCRMKFCETAGRNARAAPGSAKTPVRRIWGAYRVATPRRTAL